MTPTSEGVGDGSVLLSSLAILSVDATRQRSYLDHFVPFAIQALSMIGGQGKLDDISGAIDSEFGFRIESIVIKEILRRAEGHSYVSRVDEVYSLTDKAVAIATKFDVKRNATLSAQQTYIAELIDFVRDRHQVIWTVELAQASLEHFILNLSVRSIIDLLSRKLQRENLILNQEDPQGSYLVSDFVFTRYLENPTSVETLENMVKGSMLAFAIFLPTPIDQTRKFRNTTLWIDTSIALQWLGLEGAEKELYVKNAIALAQKQGVEIGIFAHTLSEMRSIILSAATDRYNPVSPRPRAVAKHCADKNLSVIQIVELADGIDRRLTELGVIISPTPRIENYTAVDESALEEAISNRLRYIFHASLVRDVDSLSAVSRLRNGHKTRQMEDCRSLFVTDNGNLVGVANEFFSEGTGEFGVAITLEELAWLVWIKDPITEVNLPRYQIIADVISILDPSDEMWMSYLDELDRLAASEPITAESLAVFRSAEIMGNMLMEVTQGDASKVTTRNVKSMLDSFTANVGAHIQEEYEAKLAQERARSEQQIEELTPLLETAAEFEKFRNEMIESCERWSRKVAYFLLSLLLLPISIDLIIAFLGLLQTDGNHHFVTLDRAIVIGIYIFAAYLFKLYRDFTGTSLKDAHAKLSGSIQKILQKYRLRWKSL